MILILNIITLLFAPFLMLGVINKTKAFWGLRKGAPLLQPLFDFIKLLKKDYVISRTTSNIFKIAPLMVFVSVVFAGLFVPLINGFMILNIPLGIILFAYILSFSKFVSLISAMDTGSSFEGMGASREACFTTIVEPAFFVTVASIMALSGNYTFDSLHEIISSAGSYGILITFFSVIVIFIMILIECSRIPVDDPNTHLELTMIHEVMVLDNSGSDLALYTYANGIKMLFLSSLIANLIIPCNLGFGLSFVLYFAVLWLIGFMVGTIESGMARIRMSHIFEFVFITSSIALVILSLVSAKMYGGQI